MRCGISSIPRCVEKRNGSKLHIEGPGLIFVLAMILAVSGLMLMASQGAFQVSAQDQAPQATLPPVMPRNLTPYVLPEHPNQADQGGQVYYLVCMVCHGDQGQGLTKQWIADSIGTGPLNCYSARCHGPHHPPDGFVLPKNIPPVRTPGLRTSFKTAGVLYEYIRSRMPYQAPGSLKDDEYWQLTAFIMRINGIDLGNLSLNADNAKQISLSSPQPETAQTPPVWLWWLAGCFLVIIGLLFFGRKLKK